ncbi:hypothetical protein FA95DRAFT_1486652 [Auriscalpium vulgare]|uniref:Uncharacterized protein n=1 Tax=Auriscalpium vulgare TaxID=40419 RepID=A0ACB8S428_9AGAM|nr:hypothetical protein FA95DRAFT_1486652 [Auriscalpium vulgare]
MPSNLSLDRASIVSLSLEAFLYGFSVFMYGVTLWVLLRPATTINRPMAVVASILFLCSTMASLSVHVVLDVYRLKLGFIDNRDFFNIGPSAWFGDISQYTFLFKNSLYVFQTLTGDGIVIYRCYVVWQSVWVIVLPALMYCGLAVCGVGAVYTASKTSPQAGIFAGAAHFITAYFSLTLATNLMSTLLLAYRIWSTNSRVKGQRIGPSLIPVVLVFVDAAVLYSMALVIMIVCFVSKLNAQYIVLDTIMPIIPITFYMVMIRLRLRRLPSSLFAGQTVAEWAPQSNIGLRHLQVQIDHLTEYHQDAQVFGEVNEAVKQPESL